MFESVLDALSLVFIIFGIFFGSYIILTKLMTRKGNQSFFAVVPGFSGDDNLPEEVFSAYLQINLLSFIRKNEVIIIDFGIEEKIKEDCKRIVGNSESIFFCTPEDFSKIMNDFC